MTEKIVYDIKKPFGEPNGIKVGLLGASMVAVGLDAWLLPQAIPNNMLLLLSPTPLLMIPMIKPLHNIYLLCWKHRDIYRPLKNMVHASNLLDEDTANKGKGLFGTTPIIAGVKFEIERSGTDLIVNVYPRGIKHSDVVYKLGQRFEELFNMSLYDVDSSHNDHVIYMLSDVRAQRLEVTDNDYLGIG